MSEENAVITRSDAGRVVHLADPDGYAICGAIRAAARFDQRCPVDIDEAMFEMNMELCARCARSGAGVSR